MTLESTIAQIALAFLIGYLDDIYGPQPHHYKNQVVIVDKKYQCPTYCGVNHNHSVYFESDSNGMIVDENQLGERFKIKKNRKKIKSLTYIDQ